jgi:hypothetical protein
MEAQTEIVFPEWRNQSEHTNYPFSDRATMVSSGGVRIPKNLFDDARFYPIGAIAGVYLKRVTIQGNIVTMTIADPERELATGSFDYTNPGNDVVFRDGLARAAGVLVSTTRKLLLVPASFPSEVTFTQDQAEFAPSCVVPLPQPGVRGFLLDDGSYFTSDIFLVGVDGIVLTVPRSNVIRVDVLGDPYARLEECEEEGIPVDAFCGLKTINNIPPDPETGDFKISPGANPPYAMDNVLRVRQTARRLIIETVGTQDVFT